MGWRVFQQHAFLDDLLRTREPLDTIFGYSCTCDPTIISGKLPHEHGHFSFFSYDPACSPFGVVRWLDLVPRWITRRGRVRRRLSQLIQWYHGYTGYFQIYNVPLRHLPLFDYTEKKDLYQPGGLINGTPTIFDHLRQQEIPFALSNWRKSEQFNIAHMRREIEAGEIAFGYLYMADLDGIMHADGTNSPRVAKKISWYDQQLRDLLAAARGSYDDVRLYVFADHGMTDVTSDYDLMAVIDRLGLRFGRDYVAMYDSTIARFWFLRDGVEERIRAALASEQHGRILSDDELKQFGAYFDDGRYGELFFLLDPGVLMCSSFMNQTHMAGMHGYDPAHEDSVALFASNVEMASAPRRLDDLYDLMKYEADVCGRLSFDRDPMGSAYLQSASCPADYALPDGSRLNDIAKPHSHVAEVAKTSGEVGKVPEVLATSATKTVSVEP